MLEKNYSRCWLPDVYSESWVNLLTKNQYFLNIYLPNDKHINWNIIKSEILFFFQSLKINFINDKRFATCVFYYDSTYAKEEYSFYFYHEQLYLVSKITSGFLYAFFHILRLIQLNQLNTLKYNKIIIHEKPNVSIRMINHWDNLNGTIERGYAGNSIFFLNNRIHFNLQRIQDYCRLLCSIGINAICLNNVNVNLNATYLITREWLIQLYELYNLFNQYNIKLFLSINYLSPVLIGNLTTYDPLDKTVQEWWMKKVTEIYEYLPQFGGFVIKANSEGTAGPLDYGRDHAQGSQPIAKALQYFQGILFWRCFVYNSKQNWRNRNIDRACAAYDHFHHLDGLFERNVVLQIKNGPMDFQVREPVSPLLGSMPYTSQSLELQITQEYTGLFERNVVLQIKNGPMDFQVREPVSPLLGSMPYTSQSLELQITQEYTGQQVDLCWLVPQWKTILSFDTYHKGVHSTIAKLVSGNLYNTLYTGIIGVSNIGDNYNWTGHYLAQANFYCFGKLLWNLNINIKSLLSDWIQLSISNDPKVISIISKIMYPSWTTYEKYTSPLGIGWMVTPNVHYGPNIDGYEYSNWGTYHYANRYGLGINRTTTGSNYVSQYHSVNKEIFNNIKTCPVELLLFFHHLSYNHILELESQKTIIQYIYDTHYQGVQEIYKYLKLWRTLEKSIPDIIFKNVYKRIKKQYINAIEWRDQINTYFYRKSGIKDILNRKIYV